jgi:hypothetical protein
MPVMTTQRAFSLEKSMPSLNWQHAEQQERQDRHRVDALSQLLHLEQRTALHVSASSTVRTAVWAVAHTADCQGTLCATELLLYSARSMPLRNTATCNKHAWLAPLWVVPIALQV